MQNHLQDGQQLNELINGWMHHDWGEYAALACCLSQVDIPG